MTYAEQLQQDRKKRLQRFAQRAVEDTPIRCLSASERTAAAHSCQKSMADAFPEPTQAPTLIETLIAEVWPSLPLDLPMAWSDLDKDELREPWRPSVRHIQRIVANAYGTRRNDMISPRRTADVVRPRQVAMYLAKTITLRSFPDIGRRFGGRDHTTVLHAVRKIGDLITTDPALAAEIDALKQQIEGYPA